MSSWPPLSTMTWDAVGVGKVCEVQCEGKMSRKAERLAVFKASGGSHCDMHYATNYIPEPCISIISWFNDDGSPARLSCLTAFFGAIAAHGAGAGNDETMALAGVDALVDPTPTHPIPSLPLVDGVEGGGLETAADGRSEASDVAEVMVAESGQQDDNGASSGLSDLAISSGHDDGLHGGRGDHVRAEDAEEEEAHSQTTRSPTRRNPSSPTRTGWPTRRARRSW